jgi:hypothetical protein
MKMAVQSKPNSICGSRLVVKARTLIAVSRRVNTIRTQAFISDVSKYLSDAASQIFSPMNDDVPWERVAEHGFSGKIEHHEAKNLHHLAENIRSVRHELEKSVDLLSDDENEVAGNEIELPVADQYISATIGKLFDPKAVVNSAEPQKYYSGGYRARGRTQREVRRDIGKLRRFEEVVSSTIDKTKK